ncbi:hypothetical protein [Pseudomonas putida]|uniref:Uncharacterized protein n=1 Tax=Pseudomonas putida TaxID=303 RepID=A0A8I1EGY7_PSEPU|nr:hypothetical protein [Pseudomonas putida]MBI6885077.1 hypothetical protein [Pseudomonas putida]
MPIATDMTYVIQLKNGYTVRITRFNVRKEFYDHHHGGREGALAAALQFRDAQRKLHGILARPDDSSKPVPRMVSRTGRDIISGVYLNIDKGSAYFICPFHNGQSWQKKRFSIKKLGYEKAFWDAVDMRLSSHNLPVAISRNEITLYRPSMEEYLFLVTISQDVPVPTAATQSSDQQLAPEGFQP